MKYPLLSFVLLAIALPAFPQTAPQYSPNPAPMWQHWFDRAATELNMTAAQKTEARKILESAQKEAQPLRRQLAQQRQALFDAVKADRTADLDRLSREHGALLGRMIGVQTHAFARIYATLTPEQKTRADQLYRHMMEGIHGGMGMHVPPHAHTQS